MPRAANALGSDQKYLALAIALHGMAAIHNISDNLGF
jgi:hypothetical protein